MFYVCISYFPLVVKSDLKCKTKIRADFFGEGRNFTGWELVGFQALSLGFFYSIGYGLGSAVMEVRVFCGWNLEVGYPQGRKLNSYLLFIIDKKNRCQERETNKIGTSKSFR